MAPLSPVSSYLWLCLLGTRPARREGPLLTTSHLFSPSGARERRREPAWRSPMRPPRTMTRTPCIPRLRGGTPSPPTMLGGIHSQGGTLQQGGILSRGGTLWQGGTPSQGWPCPPCLFGSVSGGSLEYFLGDTRNRSAAGGCAAHAGAEGCPPLQVMMSLETVPASHRPTGMTRRSGTLSSARQVLGVGGTHQGRGAPVRWEARC